MQHPQPPVLNIGNTGLNIFPHIVDIFAGLDLADGGEVVAAGREGELVDGPGAEAGAVQGVTPRLRLGGVHRHPGPGLALDTEYVIK